jgi:hypothetical protein
MKPNKLKFYRTRAWKRGGSRGSGWVIGVWFALEWEKCYFIHSRDNVIILAKYLGNSGKYLRNI